MTIIVQLCNCSQHGECVWDEVQEGFNSSDTFSIVACDCEPLYDGSVNLVYTVQEARIIWRRPHRMESEQFHIPWRYLANDSEILQFTIRKMSPAFRPLAVGGSGFAIEDTLCLGFTGVSTPNRPPSAQSFAIAQARDRQIDWHIPRN